MANEYQKVISEKMAEAKHLMNPTQLKKCNIAIHTATAASATAGAVPIPVVDALPITACQVSMVLALGKIFDREITKTAAKGLVGAVSATFVGRNLVKVIPIVGWGVSAAVAAGVTEAVGWTIAVNMAQEAKNEWENGRYSSDSSEQTVETGKIEEDEIIPNLRERVALFLSKEKTQQANKEEYDELIRDFERVLDNLPKDDPLVKAYDDLCTSF